MVQYVDFSFGFQEKNGFRWTLAANYYDFLFRILQNFLRISRNFRETEGKLRENTELKFFAATLLPAVSQFEI